MSLKIRELNPSSVKVGWVGSLTIYGADLGKPGFVSIEGGDPPIESWSATQIVVNVSKSTTESQGKKRLVVHDEGGNFDETQWTVER